MASLISKVLNFVGIEEENEMEESKNEAPREKIRERKKAQPQNLYLESKNKNKIVNIHSSAQLKVVVMQPQNIEDAREISDYLKENKPIIVNLEELEKDAAQRILDFLSGSVYSLDGQIQRVSNSIFLIVPNNVDVTSYLKENESSASGILPWVQ